MTSNPETATPLDRLGGAHEWGYRDVTDGTFISDDTPFDAFAEIERLRSISDRALSEVRSAVRALDALSSADTLAWARSYAKGSADLVRASMLCDGVKL